MERLDNVWGVHCNFLRNTHVRNKMDNNVTPANHIADTTPYKVCNSGVILMIYENKYVHFCVYSISALCLEIYLCQLAVITPRLNHIFPFNIPIIIIGVILLAYIVKVFSNFFSQTFKEQDYNWKAIFKL